MSMRLIEENEQHFTSNNSGKWEKEILYPANGCPSGFFHQGI